MLIQKIRIDKINESNFIDVAFQDGRMTNRRFRFRNLRWEKAKAIQENVRCSAIEVCQQGSMAECLCFEPQ